MNHPKDYAAVGSHVPGEALRGIPRRESLMLILRQRQYP